MMTIICYQFDRTEYGTRYQDVGLYMRETLRLTLNRVTLSTSLSI